jgi:molybdenum cofactor cytidylyltransferase
LGFDEEPKLAGLILAGGEGSRFGGPKAWAELPDGRSFLEACAMTLREAGASPIVATLPPHSNDPRVESVRALPLPEPGLDMFASLRFGIECLIASRGWATLAVLPVDHPLVRPQSVIALAAPGTHASVPTYRGKHGHPVCIAREVADAILDGTTIGATLRDVMEALRPVQLEIDDPGVVANCNTPAALSEALDATGFGL